MLAVQACEAPGVRNWRTVPVVPGLGVGEIGTSLECSGFSWSGELQVHWETDSKSKVEETYVNLVFTHVDACIPICTYEHISKHAAIQYPLNQFISDHSFKSFTEHFYLAEEIFQTVYFDCVIASPNSSQIFPIYLPNFMFFFLPLKKNITTLPQ